MHLSNHKLYDSIDHVVACDLYGTIFNKPQISAYICAYKQFHTIIWVWIWYKLWFWHYFTSDNVVFKPHPLTVIMVSEYTYENSSILSADTSDDCRATLKDSCAK